MGPYKKNCLSLHSQVGKFGSQGGQGGFSIVEKCLTQNSGKVVILTVCEWLVCV